MTIIHRPRQIAGRVLAVGVTIAALATPSTAGATDPRPHQRGREQQSNEELITRAFEVGEDGRLEISNVAGRIIVRGVAGSTITINATKRVRPRGNEDPSRALEDLEVDIEQRGGRVEVRTRHNRGGRRRARVDYDVTVPTSARVMLRSVSGDIQVNDVNGELHAQAVSGDVRITSAGRLSVARSVSGNVRIETATASDDLTIASVSGDVVAENLEADRLELETVSGEMRIRNVNCHQLAVSTVSGELDYEGGLAEDGRYELRSHSGDVLLVLTEDVGFDLTADTFSGDFEFDLPVTLEGNQSASDDCGRGRGRGQRSIRGRYGDGSARIEVVTFSGDLSIRTRN